jgi:alpha-tubulin suppressor-like RCC1 family protein
MDGTASCWGDNTGGALGDGTTTNRLTPTPVSGLTSVSQLAAGWNHTCALKTDASLYCWGNNPYGQLGDGTTTARATPTVATTLGPSFFGTKHAWVGAGFHSSCALENDGTTNRSSPSQVQLGTKAIELALNGYETLGPLGQTCAIASDGSVACWGANAFGQLGDGTTIDRSSPVTLGAFTAAVQRGAGALTITTGAKHACAVLPPDIGLVCWGANDVGQLGNGGTTEAHVPTAASLACP